MIEKRGENAIPSEKLHLFEKSYNKLCYLEHNLELRKRYPYSPHKSASVMALQICGSQRKVTVAHRALPRLTAQFPASVQQDRIITWCATCTCL